MAASNERKLPTLFYRKAEEDQITPGEVAQRIFRKHIVNEKPRANPDHPYFLLQTNSASDKIEFMGSFRNKFTALAIGRRMAVEDDAWGECGPIFTYYAFDIEGNWIHTPISSMRDS